MIKAIWIKENKNNEIIRKSHLRDNHQSIYEVYELKKEYKFNKIIKSFNFKFVGDCVSIIYVNNKLVAPSNNKSIGDFYNFKDYNNDFYWSNVNINNLKSKSILINSFVQFYPSKLCDFSSGKGGFILKGEVIFIDNSKKEINIDETWLIRLNIQFNNIASFDNTIKLDDFSFAKFKNLNWTIKDTLIKMPILENIVTKEYKVKGNSKKIFIENFKKIYSSKYTLKIECQGLVIGKIISFENNNQTNINYFKFNHNDTVHYFDLESVGKYKLEINNKSNSTIKLTLILDHCHYDYKDIKLKKVNDKRLDDLYQKCLDACINCSQSYLLDSPKHQEPFSSCMGDYQIITLALSKVSKDYSLVKHVLKGISDTLVKNKGYVSNSNYALIYINWLYKIYELTKDKELLKYCLKGVINSIKLFNSFVSKRGIIDHPYNYIFMDWLVIDNYNLFSPPMALGQTVLNMYYYEANKSISKIYFELGDKLNSKIYLDKSNKLKDAINKYFFNQKLGLYKEGLQDPLPINYRPFNNDYSKATPENINKEYYMKHSNILAVAFNLIEGKDAKILVDKIFTKLKNKPIQPYFLFYAFIALKNTNLMKKYKKDLLNEWLKNTKITDKGLKEGFYKPSKDYVFDYSHAWGASPLYFIDD